MSHKLDEQHYVENPFLAQLQSLGWKIYRQNKENPEDIKEITSFNADFKPVYANSVKFRESFREIILKDVLKNSIKKINPWIEEDQINQVIRKITTPSVNTLLEANKEIHSLLLENTSVSENRETEEKSPTVKFIDFKNIDNNSFIAISQYKVNITGTEKHIIPDIVLFINGLPLVVIECKSPAISEPIREAIIQITRYSNKRGINEGNEKLFWYNLFTIATSKQTAKYGTITADYEHFFEWKDPYPYTLSDIDSKGTITSQQVLIQGILSKNNFLDILHTFTLFKENIKIVARYQQFRAVKKIIKRLKQGKTPQEKGGIIWHTQGSGKSLTMMFAVREMYHTDFKNFKIVFITDRKDLEKQLSDTSKSVGYTVKHAKNIESLKNLLKTDTPELVMGMMHKFQERELKKEFPVLNTSPNILIMIDEAHRTQYKLLGANLRKALPNAVKIAFTGTPIEKTEKSFGDYLDKYSIKQAIKDNVTVEIVYEGRVHSAKITNEEAANIKFEDVFSKIDAKEKAKIMGRYTWKAYLENENVIKDKAKDMLNHYITHVFPNGFKAQVVSVSRLAAIRYKKALEDALNEKIKELKQNNHDNILSKLKIEVIISKGQNDDPKDYPPEYTDSNKHETIIESFKLPFREKNKGICGDVGIIVVNNMLITGFDAPIEQVMYLDNVIKEHNLLQAIARVNRTHKNKSCGFVVDYVGVLKHLREALSIYADEDIDEITQVVINKAKLIDDLKYTQNLINDFFKKHEIENWRYNVDECIDLLVDEEIRNEFIILVRRFSRLIDALLPSPIALKYVSDLKELNFIKESARNRYRDEKLSLKDASKKIREIVEEYLISKGVNPKIAPIPLFNDEFITELHKQKSSKGKAEELKNAIIEHIEKNYKQDPEFYQRFSDRLNMILEEYKENWSQLAKELEKLRNFMKKGRESENTFGFDPKKEMPFFGVLKQSIYGKKSLKEEDIQLLINLTREIIEIIKREVQLVDFWDNSIKQKKLKSYIISNILLPKSNNKKFLFKKRKEIAQNLMELAYHIYGKEYNYYT